MRKPCERLSRCRVDRERHDDPLCMDWTPPTAVIAGTYSIVAQEIDGSRSYSALEPLAVQQTCLEHSCSRQTDKSDSGLGTDSRVLSNCPSIVGCRMEIC